MANPILMGSEKYKIAKSLEVATELSVPILANITTAPPNSSLPAVGSFNNVIYNWDVAAQAWVATGTGVGGSWSSNESFAS